MGFRLKIINEISRTVFIRLHIFMDVFRAVICKRCCIGILTIPVSSEIPESDIKAGQLAVIIIELLAQN